MVWRDWHRQTLYWIKKEHPCGFVDFSDREASITVSFIKIIACDLCIY